MSPAVQNPSDQPSMVSLMGGIVSDFQELIKQQVALTKEEVKSDLRKAKEGAVKTGIGAALLVVGALLLCLMLVHLLHWLTSPAPADPATIPLWGCYGIVAAAFGVIGGVLAKAGMGRFEAMNLPEKAARDLKENVEWKMKK